MEWHTKCSCDNTPSNCISCFEIRLCLNRMWHSIYISQTIKQKGKAKNKITKTKGNRLIFLLGKELHTPHPTPIIHTCMFNKIDKIFSQWIKRYTSSNSTRPRKVRFWQPGSAVQKEMTCVPECPSTSGYAFPWQSCQRNNPLSLCVAYKVTRLSLGAYRCKYFCIWSCKWNTNKHSETISISTTHHRARKKAGT